VTARRRVDSNRFIRRGWRITEGLRSSVTRTDASRRCTTHTQLMSAVRIKMARPVAPGHLVTHKWCRLELTEIPNTGIKRRLTFLARKRQDVSGRATRIRRYDALVTQSVLACHRLPRVSCQISCWQTPNPRISSRAGGRERDPRSDLVPRAFLGFANLTKQLLLESGGQPLLILLGRPASIED
jgi:hypothetical protein